MPCLLSFAHGWAACFSGLLRALPKLLFGASYSPAPPAPTNQLPVGPCTSRLLSSIAWSSKLCMHQPHPQPRPTTHTTTTPPTPPNHAPRPSSPCCTGLTSLQSLSLRGTLVSSVACLQRCQALTALTLAGCPLGPNLAAALPPLPCLLLLDASACRLAALGPLPATCPLLRTLIASRNNFRSLPGDLHLPFLTELWLNECGMAGVECWPWLPALRGLHLQVRRGAVQGRAPASGPI